MAKRPYQPIQQQFEEYHAANPHVYDLLVAKARAAVAQGYNNLGIALLVELVRWDHSVGTEGKDHFKICNDYRSRYARTIMAENADLRGFFRIRALEAA